MTRKGVRELRGLALVCLGDKNLAQYFVNITALFLNVQDIIEERTKDTSISSTYRHIPSTTIAGAGQHPCNTNSLYASLRCIL